MSTSPPIFLKLNYFRHNYLEIVLTTIMFILRKEKISSNVQYLNAYRTNLGENDESDILLLVIIVVKYEVNHNAQHNE